MCLFFFFVSFSDEKYQTSITSSNLESNGSQDGHLWATSHNLFPKNNKNYGEVQPKGQLATSIQSSSSSSLINDDNYGKQNNNQLKKLDNFLQSNNDFTTRPNLNQQQSPQSLFTKNDNDADNNKKDIIKFGMVYFEFISHSDHFLS